MTDRSPELTLAKITWTNYSQFYQNCQQSGDRTKLNLKVNA